MHYFLICALLLSRLAVAAPDVQPFPRSELRQAIELVQEFLAAPAPKRLKFRNQLQKLEPSGPVFVDEVLKLIAANRDKWKATNEPRSSMLRLVSVAIRGSLPWEDFDGSTLKQSIHKSAQSLLELFPNSSLYQDDLLEIFHRLDLWDASDMKFLIGKSFAGRLDTRYLPRIIENFKAASPEDRQLLVDRARKQTPRQLVPYALAYQTGVLDQQDYLWLLRLLMDYGLNPPIDIMKDYDFGSPEPIGIFSDKEILRRNQLAIDNLLYDVQQNFNARLRAGDPIVKAVYDEARSGKWRGRSLSADDKAIHQHYLRALYTGSLVSGCDQRLSTVAKDPID